MNVRLVIFDGDDTLWETMPLYTAAKEEFYDSMARFGFDREAIPEVFEQIDLKNARHLGFGRQRFPNSMVETYRIYCGRLGITPNRAAEEAVWSIGDSVFERHPVVFPEAVHVLEAIRQHSRLALLTKGDEEVQRQRVETSGLAQFFDPVCIVATKGRAEFEHLALRYHVHPRESWSVGNSLKSDINPALAVGMSAIWIPYHTWDAETDVEVRSDRLHKVNSLRDCLQLLDPQGKS